MRGVLKTSAALLSLHQATPLNKLNITQESYGRVRMNVRAEEDLLFRGHIEEGGQLFAEELDAFAQQQLHLLPSSRHDYCETSRG